MIVCRRCGKVYSYEKTEGICPKCCAFNRLGSSNADHEKYHEMYDSTKEHGTALNEKSAERKNKAGIIWIVIVAIYIFFELFGDLLAH